HRHPGAGTIADGVAPDARSARRLSRVQKSGCNQRSISVWRVDGNDRSRHAVSWRCILLLAAASPVVAQTQTVPDSSVHRLPNVVVTADRVPGILGTHT